MPVAPVPPRIALVGFGGWGPNLARVLAHLGHLAAIYDSAPQARRRAQSVHPNVLCRTKWHPEPSTYDAVVLATPAASHADLAKQALDAGLDVFVEKPLALTPAEAQALVRSALGTGRILMVGHLLLYHPAIAVVHAGVRQNQLGPLRQILSERHNFGVIRQKEDVLLSLGPHDVAVILHVTGALPTHVLAQGQCLQATPRPDSCQMHLRFSDTLSARISLSWLHPVKAQRLIVQGAHAALVHDDVLKTLVLQPMATTRGPNGDPQAQRAAAVPLAFAADEPLTVELAAFIDALRTRRLPRADAQHGADVVRVLAAAQRSLAEDGRIIALPHS